MRASFLTIGLLAVLSPVVSAWSKEDREIFRIRDEIATHESDTAQTFYDILEILPSASHEEITKAYRQKSRSLHPDKVKQQLLKASRKYKKEGAAAGTPPPKPPSKAQINAAIKKASERQTRLSLIANILRGPGRDRYDHFLANGFPLWKGTDYYYNRYRPGLGTVITGLFLLVGGAVHYLVLYMSWKRQREFIDRYIRFARDTAWGSSMNIPGVDTTPVVPAPASSSDDDEDAGPPQPMNRRQRRMQEKETRKEEGKPAPKKTRKALRSAPSSGTATPSATGTRKRVVAENGKILVVDSAGNVYLEGKDEEGNMSEYLLDPEELVLPTFKDTAVVRVPLWIFNSTVGRFIPKPADEVETIISEDEQSEDAQNTPSTGSASEDFEIVDKTADSLEGSAAKSTGTQQGGKAKKRNNKKR